MIRNYFKIAWRNILKNKTFSVINIAGLAIGISAFLLIVNYLRFQYSFDNFHERKERIFRVPMVVSEKDGKPQNFAFTYPALAPAMKKDLPEIAEAARLRIRWGVVQHGEKKFVENGMIYYADPSVFRIFSFAFEKGTPASAFTRLNDAVITHSTAEKYFGQQNPIGKTLHYDNEDYIVTAVLKDIPANSHLQFNIVLNYDKYIQLSNGNANTSWGWSDFYTYILLKPGTDAELVQSKMDALAQRYMGSAMQKNGYTVSFKIQPLADIHTKSVYDYEMNGSGNLYYLKYLGIAALFILLIALINYINLSTARSLERSKEVGVRKVIGATRPQLIRQFLAEAFLVNLMGIVCGFLLFTVALPSFSQLIGQDVANLQTTDWPFWVTIFSVFMISSLLAGFYPAFVLSSFQPIQSLKSAAGFSSMKRGSTLLRKSLVIVQFAAAIVLIGGAIGFYRQLHFMSNRNLGININETLVLQQTIELDSSKKDAVQAVMHELQKIPGVDHITASTAVPGGEVGGSSGFRLINSEDDKRCRIFGIDEKFIPHFGLSILAGRNFDKDQPAGRDTSQLLSIIINETAAKLFGFTKPSDAINATMIGSGYRCKVIGVMNDYHQQSLQHDYDPVIYYPEQLINMTNFSLKLHTTNLPQVMEKAKTTWASVFPGSPLQFFFLDEYFNRQYSNDRLFSAILWWFTLLAIVIAGLGLFGLSLYTVAKRTKEISLRKVLGATVFQIMAMIMKDYIRLIIYAGLLAVPVAYLLLRNWLNDYAFHITIGWWFFIAPLGLILFIAMITVSYQSIKAATANPVKSLRTE